jgi:pyruvate dehydrogenase E2 component (dihydrolipoamide acetyltransferase)
MATKVVMEALSPTMEEGQLVKWLKQEGDTVTVGDILAEVETDKAVMELAARGEGILRAIVAPEGATVEVGKLVAVIGQAEEDISAVVAAAPAPAPTEGPSATVAPEPESATAAVAAAGVGGQIKTSPLARRMAQERGIDLAVVQGTGPGGRIIKRDLDHIAATPTPTAPVAPGAEFRDEPLTQIRKTIARRLAESIGPVPHFFLTTEVDMERVAEARASLNALEVGPRISFNDIIMKVVAASLVQHGDCNAWWQNDHIRYFSDVHLSVAVAVEEGLITPVIRNANRKSLREIAIEIRALAERARERKLKPEEYTGGTFSVSNLGMYDIDQFTGVINPPEAGLLAVGTIMPKPVVVDDELVVRRRMRVTMSCDHRVIDGATGARFLQTTRRMLENPLAIIW